MPRIQPPLVQINTRWWHYELRLQATWRQRRKKKKSEHGHLAPFLRMARSDDSHVSFLRGLWPIAVSSRQDRRWLVRWLLPTQRGSGARLHCNLDHRWGSHRVLSLLLTCWLARSRFSFGAGGFLLPVTLQLPWVQPLPAAFTFCPLGDTSEGSGTARRRPTPRLLRERAR